MAAPTVPPTDSTATPKRRRDERPMHGTDGKTLSPTDLAARARALLARLEQPEGPGDHLANAIQLLIAAEYAFRELELDVDADGPESELHACLRVATTRCFAALTALMETALTEQG
jgi:hypothetical protein